MFRPPRHSGPRHYDRHSVVEDMHFECGVLTVQFAGPAIGEREARIIGAELEEATGTLGRRLNLVVLDLSEIHTMSSLMVGVLGDLRLQLRAARARALIWGIAPHLEGLLLAVGLDRRFRIVRCPKELAAIRAA